MKQELSRNTKRYRENILRGELKKMDAKVPKKQDKEKIKRYLGLGILIFTIAAIAAFILLGMPGLLLLLSLGCIICLMLLRFLDKQDMKIIRAYKKMDIPRDVYEAELRKKKTSPKRIEKIMRMWDRCKI